MNQKILFDISLVNKYSIINNIFECKHLLIGKPCSSDYVFSVLKKQIQKYYPILVRKKSSTDQNILVGGWYLINRDKQGKKSIILEIYFPDKATLTISNSFFSRLANSISDTILHELIHLRQYRSSNYQLEHHPQYYSKIEIEAHGFNIACELFDHLLDKTAVDLVIENNQISKYSSTWNMYSQLCNKHGTHTVMKKLKTQVKRCIPLAETGFPFKSGKWLK